MKRLTNTALSALACATLSFAQIARTGDWTTFGGDVQRTGSERSDFRLNKDTIKDFQFLWKMKLEEQPKGARSLTPPVTIGTLISYRGFKELAFVGGSSNHFYAINADLGKMFWQRQLTYSSELPQAKETAGPCGGGLTVMASLVSGFARGAGAGRGLAPAPAGGRGTNDATPPRGPANPPVGRGLAGSGGFGASRPVVVIGGDGRIHRLNTANGDDMAPPVNFLPPNSKPSSLNVYDNVVYTTTSHGCGAAPDAVWAADFNEEQPKISSFRSNGGGFWGLGGPALAPDGTVYVQVGDGPLDPESNKWSNATLALNGRDLKLKSYFSPAGLGAAPAKNVEMNAATPAVFTWRGTEMIAASGRDGRLYLLDAKAPGGPDHHTPLARTPPLSAGDAPDRGIWGGLSTWEDKEGTRWLLAPVWGPVHSELKPPAPAAAGAIVAFRLVEENGKPALKLGWISGSMGTPVPPVIANGIVFALATGPHATLYALDGDTGKELYSSKNQVPAAAARTGLTVSNGRVYFGTVDSTFYTFGIPMEH
jgi:outer membrane protein assembly factor BamB